MQENIYHEQLRLSIEFHEKEAACLRQKLKQLVASEEDTPELFLVKENKVRRPISTPALDFLSGSASSYVIGEVSSDEEDRKRITSIMADLKESQ